MKRCSEYRSIGFKSLSGGWLKAILFYILYTVLFGAMSSTFILVLLFGGPITVGLNLFFLRAVRKENHSYGDLFEPIGKGDWGRTALMFILKSIFTVLWSLFFILPGIVKTYSYAMSEFIMIDNRQCSATEAITLSRKLMKGKKWKLFCLDLSFIGWALLSILTLGFLMLFVAPYHTAARAAFYNDIKNK